jgi:toxin ParE1/3/4
MELLARQAGLGRHRDELAAGIQSFPVGRYIIFYRVGPGAIEIARVLHGARDIESIFEG